MNEIYAKSLGNTEEYSAYITGLTQVVINEMDVFYQNINLRTLINASQIVVLFIVFKLIYKRPVSQMGLSRKYWLKRMGQGCLTGFIAISLYALFAQVFGIAGFTEFNLSYLFTPNMFTSFILFVSVGFYEEILCRGFLMTVLKTTRNKWVIIAAPAVIFGFLHLLNPNVTFISIFNIILIGLAFAYMFVKTGSLWMPIGFYIMWNFFQGNIYGIQVSGMDQTAPLFRYTASGPDILTGGTFGAEGGLICTVIMLALLAYIHFVLKVKEPRAWTLENDLPFNSK